MPPPPGLAALNDPAARLAFAVVDAGSEADGPEGEAQRWDAVGRGRRRRTRREEEW